jgi:hypothetical protein
MHEIIRQTPANWRRVTRAVPCPICKKPDWCSVATDESAVCCMRIESNRRLSNGGWLHRQTVDSGRIYQRRAPPPRPWKLSSETVANTWTRWAHGTSDEQIALLAKQLSVDGKALRAMGACWAWPHEAWGFPMFDGKEEFTGIRLRSETGQKWALRGSRQGIFLPSMEPQEEALVVEGPTDAAAAVTLGFHVIGRPSCSGGAREITEYCRRSGVKRLSVIADNDEPGIKGARELCGQVEITSRMIMLPANDLREWLGQGAGRQALEACLNAHGWRM